MAILSMEEAVLTERRSDWKEIDEIFGLQQESIDGDVAVIVLKIHQPAFLSTKKSFDYRICGKTLTEWVCLAFADCPVLEIEAREDDDLLSTIKPHLSNKKYTAVFYADTPLLQRKTFLGIINYAKEKRMNVCKLERGYVFITEYLRSAERLYSSVGSNLDIGDDLIKVCDTDTLQYAQEVIKKRILSYHIERGVEILDMANTSIDADVVIGQNTVIYPNTTLLGRTAIGSNVMIYPNCTIFNSQIGNNCKIYNSVIQSSKIRDNSIIEPFCFIENGEIKNR